MATGDHNLNTETESVPETESLATAPSVGALLREAREGRGDRSLERVARELCIRPHLLAALEENNFTIFPSACYASGFLKSYATYLGLDAGRILAQFRHEFDGAGKKVELVFPEAPPRRDWPLGAMASVGSVSLAIMLGVWLFHGQVANMTSGVSSLAEMANVTKTILESSPAHETAQNPISAAPASPAGAARGDDQTADQKIAQKTVQKTDRKSETSGKTPQLAALVPEAVPAPDGGRDAGGTKVGGMKNTRAQETGQKAVGPQERGTSETRFTLVQQATAHTDRTQPRDVRATAVVTDRIRLTTSQDVWVRITGPQGDVLVDRVMQAGEAFYAPDRKGLELMTNNASALSIHVGDEALAPLGDYGQIVTKLPLEQEKLLQKITMNVR